MPKRKKQQRNDRRPSPNYCGNYKFEVQKKKLKKKKKKTDARCVLKTYQHGCLVLCVRAHDALIHSLQVHSWCVPESNALAERISHQIEKKTDRNGCAFSMHSKISQSFRQISRRIFPFDEFKTLEMSKTEWNKKKKNAVALTSFERWLDTRYAKCCAKWQQQPTARDEKKRNRINFYENCNFRIEYPAFGFQ